MPSQNKFVTWNATSGTFLLGDNVFYATGCNINWLGLAVVNDQDQCFAPVDTTRIDYILRYAKNTLHCNVIRCHTLGFSGSIDPYYKEHFVSNNGIVNDNYFKLIDYTILVAKRLGLYLIPVMTDQYNCWNGNYNVFLGDGETTDDFFNANSTAYTNYTSFLKKFLTHRVFDPSDNTSTMICEEPTIFCIEYGNELGDHSLFPDQQLCDFSGVPCYSGPTLLTSPTKYSNPTKEWFSDITSFIRGIDKNHLLMTGADWCQLEDPTPTGSSSCDGWDVDGVDIVSFHWYFDSTEVTTKYEAMKTAAERARQKNKAVIFGEYPASYGDVSGFLNEMTKFLDDKTIQGEFFWDLVYDEYKGSDSYAVSPTKNTALLKKYADHFKPFEYGSSTRCSSLQDCQNSCGSQPPPSTDRIMLVIGDSITTGYHCYNGEYNCTCDSNPCCNPDCCVQENGDLDKYDPTTQEILSNDYSFVTNCSLSYIDAFLKNITDPVQVYNFAIQGTSANACNPWRDYAYNALLTFQQQPDFIYIALGVNDILLPSSNTCVYNLNATYDALAQLITDLGNIYTGCSFLLIRPLPIGDTTLTYWNTLDQDYKNMGDEVKTRLDPGLVDRVVWIDIYDDLKNQLSTFTCTFCDKIHPLKAWNEIIGTTLAEAIAKTGKMTLGTHTNLKRQAYYQNPQCKTFDKAC
jgi:lysophospholipase L1-like esterase